jgi:G3E family GTPase
LTVSHISHISALNIYQYLLRLVRVGFNFWKDFNSQEFLKDRKLESTPEDSRTIVNLLTDQIEFANVIVINKCDLITKEQLEMLTETIKRLNTEARIIHSTYGKIAIKDIVNTGSRTDYEISFQLLN